MLVGWQAGETGWILAPFLSDICQQAKIDSMISRVHNLKMSIIVNMIFGFLMVLLSDIQKICGKILVLSQGWRDSNGGGEVMRRDLLSIGGLGRVYHVVMGLRLSYYELS